MDRITPTLKPTNQRVVQRQRWANLLFLHWVVDAEPLQKILPPGLTLDTFEGKAYVGLVPFTMTGVRPVWAPPVKPISNFHETNLRTYVHFNGENPGVWFFSLDAANSLAVKIARTFWKLPYHRADMTMDVQHPTDTSTRVHYVTRRMWPEPLPAECRVDYTVDSPVIPATPGTLEHFLAERYLLYAYRDGALYRGQVYHTPYPLQVSEVQSLNESMVRAAGINRPDAAPLSHYASEVDVHIYGLNKLPGGS